LKNEGKKHPVYGRGPPTAGWTRKPVDSRVDKRQGKLKPVKPKGRFTFSILLIAKMTKEQKGFLAEKKGPGEKFSRVDCPPFRNQKKEGLESRPKGAGPNTISPVQGNGRRDRRKEGRTVLFVGARGKGKRGKKLFICRSEGTEGAGKKKKKKKKKEEGGGVGGRQEIFNA